MSGPPEGDLSDLSSDEGGEVSWQESMLASKQRELGFGHGGSGPFGDGVGGRKGKGKKMPDPLEFDPKSLEIWNRFFENATVLNQADANSEEVENMLSAMLVMQHIRKEIGCRCECCCKPR